MNRTPAINGGAMQQNNNNSCNISVFNNSQNPHQPIDDHGHHPLQRQEVQSVATYLGRVMTEISQNVPSDIKEKQYAGSNMSSKSNNNKPEKARNMELITQENCVEKNRKRKKSNMDEVDSLENLCSPKNKIFVESNIEKCHQKLKEQIDDLQNPDVKFDYVNLGDMQRTIHNLNELGSTDYKNVMEEFVAETKNAPEENIYNVGTDKNEQETQSIRGGGTQITNICNDSSLLSPGVENEESFECTDIFLSGQETQSIRHGDTLSLQTSNISPLPSVLSPSVQREESFEFSDTFDVPGEHGLALFDTWDSSCKQEMFHLYCQCKVVNCCTLVCSKVHNVVLHLKKCSVNALPCSECQQVVKYLYIHSNICEELKCTVPFCTFFRLHSGLSIGNCLAKLYNFLARRILVMTLMEYQWLREDHQYDWVAPDFRDFWTQRDKRRLYLLNTFLEDPIGYGMFNTVQMCIDAQKQKSLYAIKKCYISDDNHQDLMAIMSKVTDNKFPQMASHLWCRVIDNSVYICTKIIEGGSLKNLINSASVLDRQTLERNRLIYFDQACMVAVHLRSLSIILLDWSSDHISLDITRQRIIFHDFSNAVTMDVTKKYTTQNKKQLKPHLTPIEVCRKQARTSQSDVWGVGTLLYELYLRKTVFYKMSHEHPEVVRNRIGCGYKPDITWCEKNKDLKELLSLCWKDNPYDRIFMQDARTHSIFLSDRRIVKKHRDGLK